MINGSSVQTSSVTAQTVTANTFTAGNVSMSNNGFVIADGPSLTATGLLFAEGPSLKATGLNMGTKQINNLAAGVSDSDAVNLKQLNEQMKKAVQDAVKSIDVVAGNNVTVTKVDADGKRTFTISSTGIKSGDDIIEVTPGPSTGSNSDSASGTADSGEGAGDTPTSTGNQTQVITAKVDFAGDTGNVTLAGKNTTLKIQGGVQEADKLTDGNIGVVADGADTLKIKLASDLKGFTSVETQSLTATDTLKVGTGDVLTTITGSAVTSTAFTAGAASMSSNGLVISEGPKFTKSEIDLAGNILHGVGKGETGTDAVNVEQLNSAIRSAVDSMKFEIVAGDNVKVTTTVDADGKRTFTISSAGIENGDDIIGVTPKPSTGSGSGSTSGTTGTEEAPAAGEAGSTGNTTVSGSQTTQVITAKVGFAGDTGSVTLGGSHDAPSSLNIKGGATGDLTEGNIGVVASGNDTLNVKLAADLTGLNSIETKTLTAENATVKDTLTVGSGSATTTITGNSVKTTTVTAETVSATTLKAGDTTVSTDGVSVSGGPTLTKTEVSMAGNQIHDVADGTAPTDAVNVRQLNRSLSDLGSRITKAQHENRAGIASAMAMASLGQPYQSGKSMLSAGASYYKGQSGFALGVSSTSANGSWLVRFAGTGNTEGDFGVAGSVNFAW